MLEVSEFTVNDYISGRVLDFCLEGPAQSTATGALRHGRPAGAAGTGAAAAPRTARPPTAFCLAGGASRGYSREAGPTRTPIQPPMSDMV